MNRLSTIIRALKNSHRATSAEWIRRIEAAPVIGY
jgi:hypothetical protein